MPETLTQKRVPLTTYTVIWKSCAHCQDRFLASHELYHPKFRIVPVFNDKPKILDFCSDACMDGIAKGTLAKCGCDYRKLIITENRNKIKYVCLTCMVVAA